MKTDLDILCVDDDLHIVNLLKFSLETEGHSVATAVTLDEAYTLLDEKQYGLFVIDLNMSDGDGFAFCRTLYERNKHTPIIIYSGRASEEQKEEAYDAGATIYITKPDGLETIQQIAHAIRDSMLANDNATIADKSEIIRSN